MRSLTIMLIAIFLLSSCEEVIEIDLRNASPRLVIEGVLSSEQGGSFVRISKTTDFFNPGKVPVVSGADVHIEDPVGGRIRLQELQPGLYVAPALKGSQGNTYQLTVSVEDKTYSGYSSMPEKTLIDSLVPEFFPGTQFAEAGHFVHCYFTDSASRKNYYRIRVIKGSFQSSFYYLFDDRLNNGRIIDVFLFGETFLTGDTAVVELLSLDFQAYDYFNTLSEVVSTTQQGMGSTPANPNSNLSPSVLGYFAAVAVDRDTLIIPPLR